MLIGTLRNVVYCSFRSLQEYSAVQDKIYGALRNQNWDRRLLLAVLVHGTA